VEVEIDGHLFGGIDLEGDEEIIHVAIGNQIVVTEVLVRLREWRHPSFIVGRAARSSARVAVTDSDTMRHIEEFEFVLSAQHPEIRVDVVTASLTTCQGIFEGEGKPLETLTPTGQK